MDSSLFDYSSKQSKFNDVMLIHLHQTDTSKDSLDSPKRELKEKVTGLKRKCFEDHGEGKKKAKGEITNEDIEFVKKYCKTMPKNTFEWIQVGYFFNFHRMHCDRQVEKPEVLCKKIYHQYIHPLKDTINSHKIINNDDDEDDMDLVDSVYDADEIDQILELSKKTTLSEGVIDWDKLAPLYNSWALANEYPIRTVEVCKQIYRENASK